MSKELPDTNAPPDVFQMFNENRTFYFESDISSLPNPPCTLPAPVARRVVPRLQKSFSQPILNVTFSTPVHPQPPPPMPPSSQTTTAAVTSIQPSPGNLHLPAAIMASTVHGHPVEESRVMESSLQSRYHTDPTYGSSSILKSFRHELNFFGQKKTSVSAPTSPRRASSPDIQVPAELINAVQLDENTSDFRKLSLVREETEKEIKSDAGGILVPQRGSGSVEPKPVKNPAELLSSLPKDSVDAQLPRQSERSLTRQMMTWFVTPQRPTSTKSSKAEFNAVTPSSF